MYVCCSVVTTERYGIVGDIISLSPIFSLLILYPGFRARSSLLVCPCFSAISDQVSPRRTVYKVATSLFAVNLEAICSGVKVVSCFFKNFSFSYFSIVYPEFFITFVTLKVPSYREKRRK